MTKTLYVLNDEPIKNAGYTFTASLISQADTDKIQTSPTLAAGDVRVSIDGGNFSNIGTLPTQIESTGILPVVLTAAEMNGDRIDILFVDAAGDEWQDLHVPIFTKVAVTLPESSDIADAVWDELLTGATHNVSTSAGKRLRELAGVVVRAETAQAGSASTITLDAAASSTDGAYDPAVVAIVGGTGTGQIRNIFQYTGSTKVAAVDRNWKTNPDATSEFVIYADAGREHVNEGLLQSATASTATLNVLASSADDAYNGQVLFIRAGTGDDQARRVTDYDGTTKVATVDRNWDTTPDGTSVYAMLPTGFNATTNLAISATEAASVASGQLAIRTYNTFSQVVTSTSTADLGGATKFWLSIKTATTKADAESVIFIEETDGLTIVNEASYATSSDGSLVVTGSSGAWVITLKIEEAVTTLLSAGTYVAELKALVSGDTVSVWAGSATISKGIVRTIE